MEATSLNFNQSRSNCLWKLHHSTLIKVDPTVYGSYVNSTLDKVDPTVYGSYVNSTLNNVDPTVYGSYISSTLIKINFLWKLSNLTNL